MFTGPQMHLMLNHLPVVGFVLMLPVLVLTWVFGKADFRRAGMLGVVVVGLLALPAYLTGEPAEEGIEHLAGVSESTIEVHEEAAEVALVLALVTAGLAAAAWVATRRSDRLLGVAMPVVTLAALATTGVMAWVGHEGGKIRHPEIGDATSAAVGGQVPESEADHDDD